MFNPISREDPKKTKGHPFSSLTLQRKRGGEKKGKTKTVNGNVTRRNYLRRKRGEKEVFG